MRKGNKERKKNIDTCLNHDLSRKRSFTLERKILK